MENAKAFITKERRGVLLDRWKGLVLSKHSIRIIVILAAALRIWLSWLLGNYIVPNASYDDQWMLNAADLFLYFDNPSHESLIKYISYPLFLNLPVLTGLTYNVVLSLYWLIGALLVRASLKRVTSNEAMLLGAYLFVLYCPIAFSSYVGQRIYRNAILCPALFILFSLSFMVLWECWRNDISKGCSTRLLGFSCLLSVQLVFCFYIKEDSVWMLLFMGVVVIGCSIGIVRRFRFDRQRSLLATSLVFILLPVVALQLSTVTLQIVNKHYFGVELTNTRTEGELAGFVERVYKIDSNERSSMVWAPYDAIEQAFDASPTLSGYPKLKERIFGHDWFMGADGDMKPISGDFLAWVIITSLGEAEMLDHDNPRESAADIQRIFREANREIDDAFEDGRIEKTDSIFLVSSGGPRTVDEIMALWDDVMYILLVNLIASDIPAESHLVDDEGISKTAATVASQQDDLLQSYFARNGYMLNQTATVITDETLQRYERLKTTIGLPLIKLVCMFYRVIAIGVVVGGILAWMMNIVALVKQGRGARRWWDNALLIQVACSVLFAMGLAYGFSIAWFSEFIYAGQLGDISETSSLIAYGCGVVPMFYMSFLLSICLFWELRHSPLRPR